MSDIAKDYFNQLDTLDLSDLEILSDKIASLIVRKKSASDKSVEDGLAYFNGIKGSINRTIDEKNELTESLDFKYANIN